MEITVLFFLKVLFNTLHVDRLQCETLDMCVVFLSLDSGTSLWQWLQRCYAFPSEQQWVNCINTEQTNCCTIFLCIDSIRPISFLLLCVDLVHYMEVHETFLGPLNCNNNKSQMHLEMDVEKEEGARKDKGKPSLPFTELECKQKDSSTVEESKGKHPTRFDMTRKGMAHKCKHTHSFTSILFLDLYLT